MIIDWGGTSVYATGGLGEAWGALSPFSGGTIVRPPPAITGTDAASSISGGTFVKGRWRKIKKKVEDDIHEREMDIEDERRALWRRQ